MIRRFLSASLVDDGVGGLGPRQVRLRSSTADLGRDGLSVITAGIDLGPYRQNPVVLWQHDPDRPVARAVDIATDGDELDVLVEFAPEGISAKADEICGLVKAGVVNGISLGFMHGPDDCEPIDPKKPRGAMRILRCELMEISFVSIPAVRNALVTERAADPEPAAPATEPAEAPAAVPATPPQPAVRRSLTLRRQAGFKLRGLYAVGELAYLLNCLGWATSDAEWEAAFEEDGSQVPAMLAKNLSDLGETLIAMTVEEVAELIAEHAPDDAAGEDVSDLPAADVVVIEAAATPAIRRFRTGYLRTRAALTVRAGKTLSAATVQCLRAALDSHDAAIEQHRAAIKTHRAAMDSVEQMLGAAETDGEDAEPTQQAAPEPAPSDDAEFRRRQAVKLRLAAVA